MGFFSWKTQDTNRSIPNVHSDIETFKVTMTDNAGNRWSEQNYNGFGRFGVKDFYILLAEMNGLPGKNNDPEAYRDKGIELYNSGEDFISPNLTECSHWDWINEAPKDCKFQGYYYADHFRERFRQLDELRDWFNSHETGVFSQKISEHFEIIERAKYDSGIFYIAHERLTAIRNWIIEGDAPLSDPKA